MDEFLEEVEQTLVPATESDTGVPHEYLHQLRHTSAIETLDAGVDLRAVQLKLGRADIRTIQGYLNMSAQRAAKRQRAFSPVERLGPGVAAAEPPPSGEHRQRPGRRRPQAGDARQSAGEMVEQRAMFERLRSSRASRRR